MSWSGTRGTRHQQLLAALVGAGDAGHEADGARRPAFLGELGGPDANAIPR